MLRLDISIDPTRQQTIKTKISHSIHSVGVQTTDEGKLAILLSPLSRVLRTNKTSNRMHLWKQIKYKNFRSSSKKQREGSPCWKKKIGTWDH